MNRSKKIYLLLGILAAACVVTFCVSRYEEHKEEIRTSDEVVLEVDPQTVTALSWEYDGNSLAFHKDESWQYDDDAAFPVDQEKIEELLGLFQAFGVRFTIEAPEDLGQYGLDDPLCTIQITAGEDAYTITLGDYSTMDEQRYVSIGDGNVYLVDTDPLDYFDVTLSDLIDHDDVPNFDQVTQIQFSGQEDWTLTYQEEGGESYREEDVYFTQVDGVQAPLDTDRVEDYLDSIRYMSLTDFVTYSVGEDDLPIYGLDDPELTVTVDYTWEDEDGNAQSDTFVLHVSRDPDQRQAAQEEQAQEQADSESESEEEEEEIIAYARVGESGIVYQITPEDYEALMAASYDDLRHQEVLPTAFADIAQMEITLDGVQYTITSEESDEEKTYYYQDQELEIADLQSALEALTADRFTEEEPTQMEEIGLTLTLDGEEQHVVQVQLYRYDGSNCLAVVDGSPLALVPRSQVVDLIEAVHAIVLN
jgi:hypothetical protein